MEAGPDKNCEILHSEGEERERPPTTLGARKLIFIFSTSEIDFIRINLEVLLRPALSDYSR